MHLTWSKLGSWSTRFGLGNMSQYYAQILIYIINDEQRDYVHPCVSPPLRFLWRRKACIMCWTGPIIIYYFFQFLVRNAVAKICKPCHGHPILFYTLVYKRGKLINPLAKLGEYYQSRHPGSTASWRHVTWVSYQEIGCWSQSLNRSDCGWPPRQRCRNLKRARSVCLRRS